MKRFLLLLSLCLTVGTVSRAQTDVPPSVLVKPAPPTSKPIARPKPPTFEQSMAKAKALKAKRDYKGAEKALWDAMDVKWNAAQPYYVMAWINIAQKDRPEAIYNFRSALKYGLKGKDAIEARAALQRMGVSEQFPKPKRRPISLTSRLMSRMILADFYKPSVGEWAVQTAITLVGAAVGWALTMLIMSWAAKQRFGAFDLKVIAFWCLTLLALRAAGQFFVSFRHVFPLVLAYMAFSVVLFLTAIGYGIRRLTTKKVMDKGGMISWGSLFTILFLVGVGGKTFMGSYFIALAVIAMGLWLLFNPWFIASQRAEALKKKGDIPGAVAMMEKLYAKPRLSDKTRFALLNDLGSNYLALNQPQLAIERASTALNYVHAFKSAEVLPRVNLAEAYGMTGRTQEAIDQLSQVWWLTETTDCIMSGAMWQGAVHGILASTNYWRGWMDEAERQADLCLAAFPAEQRSGNIQKNMVAMSRAIKGAARLASGDLETAHKYAAAAPKIGPKRGALAFCQFIASQVHEAGGQIEEAKNLARAALESSPNFFPAQLQLADLSAQSGDTHAAIGIMQQALPTNMDHHLAPLAITKLRSWGGQVPAALSAPPEPVPTESSLLSNSAWERTTI